MLVWIFRTKERTDQLFERVTIVAADDIASMWGIAGRLSVAWIGARDDDALIMAFFGAFRRVHGVAACRIATRLGVEAVWAIRTWNIERRICFVGRWHVERRPEGGDDGNGGLSRVQDSREAGAVGLAWYRRLGV